MTIEPTDYWKLRTMSADLDRDQAALAAIQARLEISRQRRQAMWAELTTKYKLDPTKSYSARDEDCSLIESQNGGPPGP